MAFTAEQIREIEEAGQAFLVAIRPVEQAIRNKLDIIYRIDNQSILVYEVRPRWDNPSVKMEIPVAKTTYVKSGDVWKIFWMRASGKWEHLQNFDSIKSPAEFFQLVEDDPMGTFFG